MTDGLLCEIISKICFRFDVYLNSGVFDLRDLFLGIEHCLVAFTITCRCSFLCVSTRFKSLGVLSCWYLHIGMRI